MDKYTLSEESYKKGYRAGLADGILAGEFLARSKARDGLKDRRNILCDRDRATRGPTCAQCRFADKTLWNTFDPPQVLCTLTGKPRLANQQCSEINRKEVEG